MQLNNHLKAAIITAIAIILAGCISSRESAGYTGPGPDAWHCGQNGGNR